MILLVGCLQERQQNIGETDQKFEKNRKKLQKSLDEANGYLLK